MTTRIKFSLIAFILLLISIISFAQEQDEQPQDNRNQINTIFNNHGQKASGGYGAMSNKFTTINGQFANMVEVYGGWYINHRFLLGVGAAALTNNIEVPAEYSVLPGVNMSYEYGQVGLMTEYVVGSNKAIHLAFQLFSGAGFTVQYVRNQDNGEYNYWKAENYPTDQNWFFVAEPGVKVEMNVFRWMRFSPGVSYRAAFGSEAKGLSDGALSGASMNLTLKFGRF
jgi:hypothetical protein